MSSSLFRRATVASARSFSTSSPRSLARISIIGNLADTPEVHSTSSGRDVLKYAVASNTGPRDNRHTSWFRVSSFAEGNRKEFLLTLTKGTLVYVEGEASITNYQDGNGQPRSGLNVIQRHIEVLKRPQTTTENE